MLICGQFSCFLADGLGLGFGMGNLIQACCSRLRGERHMERIHHIHPFFIITLLSFLHCCAELDWWAIYTPDALHSFRIMTLGMTLVFLSVFKWHEAIALRVNEFQ